MKRFLITSILAAIVAAGTTIMAQGRQEEYLGLPGDNLNLYAVMQLFQESETIEGFERSLNDENSGINNLDLNNDNMVDYIRVSDYIDGDVHNIVLQAALDRNESQDVAVFTVQRFRDGSVQIQLTGDEALYGRNYIIEPIFDETQNPGYSGSANRRNVNVVRTTAFEISAWPLVRFIFLPNYVIWHSSWNWGYYPSYWRPWNQHYWHYYYGFQQNRYPYYYTHYRHWDNHRYTNWNDFYYNDKRAYSSNVRARIEAGNYKNTYSHPEMRRDGEAMYRKMNPAQNNRSSGNSQMNNSGRRSVSKSTPDRNSGGTSGPGMRRSDNTVRNNSDRSSSSGQNTGASRRSPSSVTERSISRPQSGQRAETARTSKKSATGVTSSRRSNSKSDTKNRNSGKTKDTETKKETRRK